jgi:hypothetical protein
MSGAITQQAAVTSCCGASTQTVTRCTGCGHRQETGGIPPRQTREQPVWTWPGEIIGRILARRERKEGVS